MIKFSIERPVAVSMFYAALLLLGLVSLSRIQVNLLPEINIPRLTILTAYTNVSAGEIENLVTRPIEETLSSVNGVDKVNSKSEEGLSIISVTLSWGYDANLALIAMRQKLDLLRSSLPQDVQRSIILKFDPADQPVLAILVKPVGVAFAKLRGFVEKNIKPELERSEGTASVIIRGGEKREIQVMANSQKLFQANLTLDDLAQSINSANYNFPAGNVYKQEKEFTVRMMGEFKDVENIGDTVVFLSEQGVPIYLKSIADIRDSYREKAGATIYNDEEAIVLNVYKEPRKNTLEVVDALRAKVKDLNSRFGRSAEMAVISDESHYIRDAISNVTTNAVLGGIIAFILLFLFLGNFKSAIIISISIPVTIIATFVVMYMTGISINVMSIGGLALSVGMVVDSSTVVLESIDTEIAANPTRTLIQNAYEGVQKVRASNIAATLCNVVVFFPIVFVQSLAGEIFKELAITISVALLVSLIFSFTLVPMLVCVKIPVRLSLPNQMDGLVQKYRYFMNWYAAFIERKLEGMKTAYSRLLDSVLHNLKKTFTVGILITAAGVFMAYLLPKELFPKADRYRVEGFIEMQPGTRIESSIQLCRAIHSFLSKNKMVTQSVFHIGHDEDNLVDMVKGKKKANFIEVDFSVNKAEITSEKFIEELSRFIGQNAKISYSLSPRGDVLESVLGKTQNVIEARFSSNNATTNLNAVRYFLDSARDSQPYKEGSIVTMDATALRKLPELKISIDRTKMATTGIQPLQIGRSLKSAVQGDITTQFRQGDREIPVRVKMSSASEGKISPENISALYVKSPSKAMLQLSQFAQLQPGESSGTILRRDSRRMEVIEIKYADGKKQAVLDMLTSLRSKFLAQQGEAKGQAIAQAPGETLEIEFLEKNHETMESLKGLLLTFVLSSVLIYMIIAAQFESFLQPISVALSIPLMVPGVALALFATGNSISVISGMGIVMLVGIVVSTAIVLYEFILYFREERHVSARSTDLIAMLKKAGEVRIRPIILTQLTTIVADLPTALAIGEGSEFQAPLSIVVVLGLTISTFLTLIYFPALYLAFERLKERLSRRFMQA